MLCATLKNENKQALGQANKRADLIELRLDLFQPRSIGTLRKLCHKPVIFKLEEIDFDLLSLLPDCVDLPHTTSGEVFEEIRKRFPTIIRICSYHNDETTGDLESLFLKIRSKPAELYKIATMAQSTTDALRMLQLVKKYRCIGICMGELGSITRILAPVFGAPWTYAPCSEKQQTAPGQILLKDLVKIYNFKEHTPATSLYGLIGDPVAKSASCRLHNFAFKKLGLDAVYVKMRVNKEELKTFFPLCRALGFKGLSVTMPLKEAITGYLDDCHCQAINTVGFRENGAYGWNTDGPAALDVLEKRVKVKGKKMVLIGAGGAAWGIAVEAKKRGAHLVIVNRNFTRAQTLAKEVGGSAFPLSAFSEVAQRGYAILVNCTPVGMGEDERLPIPAKALLTKKLVMDIITRPPVTSFLKAAQEKGCETVAGGEMFIQQAVGQYCHWFAVSSSLAAKFTEIKQSILS
jgi:3-dehydroquinate dehydratase / shikimate dehydrogenase